MASLNKSPASQIALSDWQLVLLLWGDKYPISEVNHLISRLLTRTGNPPKRITLICDRLHEGLHSGAETCLIPDFFLYPDYLSGGCHAKLAMFEPNVLPEDMPAIYLDLDTIIIGDISKCLSLIHSPEQVAMLHSAGPPFGLWGRMVFFLTGGRFYARGNSSVLVFYPSHNHYISNAFRTLTAYYGALSLKVMRADDRFISWVARKHIRSIPTDFIVKLPTEFMFPWRWFIYLRAKLPWVTARRNRLIAVTMPGNDIKGQTLITLADGDEVVDNRGRVLIWTDRVLGKLKQELICYYQGMENER